jgi:Protein of unknown function with PCYCGC motif
MSHRRLVLFPLLVILGVAGSLTAGCGAGSGEDAHTLAMAPLHDMPMDVQTAPVTVQEAYQFAVANPDVLGEIPCYCGCGSMGHASNYACYVEGVDGAGKITYDPHALGCSICVDITQDTMRLLRQGQSVQEIRAYVDTTYARYGPSNMP